MSGRSLNHVGGEIFYLSAIRRATLPPDIRLPFETTEAGGWDLVMPRSRWHAIRGKPGTRACVAAPLAVVPDSAVSDPEPIYWHTRPPEGFHAWYPKILAERHQHPKAWHNALKQYWP